VNRFAKGLLVTALMVSIGAQWAVLQSAAWVGMALSYSLQERSVAEGLSKTFDGQHPCPLCKAVDKGKQSEKKNPTERAAKLQLDLFCNQETHFLTVPARGGFPFAENETGASRPLVPPLPPPIVTTQAAI
jgi:hypothetical protein